MPNKPRILDKLADGWTAVFAYQGGHIAEVALEPAVTVQTQWDALKEQVTYDAIVTEHLVSVTLVDSTGDPVRMLQVQSSTGVS